MPSMRQPGYLECFFTSIIVALLTEPATGRFPFEEAQHLHKVGAQRFSAGTRAEGD
jgi:hypothetical protein